LNGFFIVRAYVIRIRRHFLPERCPHCDQAEESINHLLLSCVFARNFLFRVFQRVGLQILAPQIGEEFFDDWWEKIILAAGGQLQKGLNSCDSWGLDHLKSPQ
jgi:hypothetical protein